VPSLFRQPQRYARFLGQELPLTPSQTLLVVMPNGYGVYRVHMPIVRERQALAAVAPPGTREPQALVAGAARAVRRLAGLRGVSAPPFDAAAATRKGTSEWGARLELAAIVAGALALAAAASYLRRRRARA
jgi:hypothetical protein